MSTDTSADAISKSDTPAPTIETPPAQPVEVPTPQPQEPPAPEPTPAEEPAADLSVQADKARKDQEEALEILEPNVAVKRWVIGKTSAYEGGSDDTSSIYFQRPLSYMARMRFFALVANTVADAVKQGGSISFGGSDIFSGDSSIRERARELTATDFGDAASFMTLALQLVSYSPDFLLECYCLWLSVPAGEKHWAKIMFDQPWNPEDQKWGLTDDQHMEIVEIFIDQNYDEIREFFTGKLPRLAQRVREREAQRKVRESASVPSKR